MIDLRERIEQSVEFDLFGGCWLWARSVVGGGYGKLRVSGRHWLAHRASWAAFRGDIGPGMDVLHRCDVRPCVNPTHLFLGTQTDNGRDMVAKGRASPRRGTSNPAAILTEATVAQIRDQIASGVVKRRIAEEFGVSPQTISGIAVGRSWR